MIRQILSAAICLQAFSVWAVLPQPLQNYCPVVVVNNTTLSADQIYFVAHGNDLNGIPCFLVPDGSGICQFAYPTPSGAPSSAGSSVTLDQLPTATGTGIPASAYLIYLPINSSSRGYFSIKFPMYLATALNPALGVLGIDDSSVTSLTDPNFYTLYQDFEFGMVTPVTDSSTQLYLNLSWVDYFCLPMQLNSFEYPSGTEINNDKSQPAGMPSSATRSQIISTTNSGLTSGQTYASWGNLGIPYYANPYTDTAPLDYLRILAAKNSIGLSTSVQFLGAKVPQTYFPSTYASSTSQGPAANTSFMQAVYNFYKNGNSLTATIFPANAPTAVYQITSTTDSANLQLQFVCTSGGGPTPITLDLVDLSMEKLLSGATWPFDLVSPAANINYTNELSKLLSALFTIGQLPLNSGSFVNNNSGFANFTYFLNPNSYSGGPWFNLYDQLLHKQMITNTVPSNPTLGLGYAYDFDDLLNMSGLINGMTIQDQYANPSNETGASKPYIMVTLGSLQGSVIPDITQDSYTFAATIGPAPNGVDVSFSHYNGASTVNTPASATQNTSLGNVVVDASHPFRVTFSFNSVNYTYNVNLLRQIVTPISDTSSYSTIDAYFQGGVTFSINGGTQSNPTFLIEFNSAPPPWPG
jgi:hypothetical protein